jgi:hypothetical protein
MHCFPEPDFVHRKRQSRDFHNRFQRCIAFEGLESLAPQTGLFVVKFDVAVRGNSVNWLPKPRDEALSIATVTHSSAALRHCLWRWRRFERRRWRRNTTTSAYKPYSYGNFFEQD